MLDEEEEEEEEEEEGEEAAIGADNDDLSNLSRYRLDNSMSEYLLRSPDTIKLKSHKYVKRGSKFLTSAILLMVGIQEYP